MENLIHADIFFFVTTILAIVITTVILVASYYVIRILRSVRHVAEKIKDESEHMSDDIAELRGRIKEGRVQFSAIGRTLGSFFLSKATVRKRRKSDNLHGS